jgi:Esterase-like activity of phytase
MINAFYPGSAFPKPAALMRDALCLLAVALTCLFSGCATASKRQEATWPIYHLEAESSWQLNLPRGQQFDASGLVLTADHDLLTVSDRGSSVYKIQFPPAGHSANLAPLPDCFTAEQLQSFAHDKIGRYDCEGLAVDQLGRLYLCEEANRWVLRWSPQTKKIERLNIDWSPVMKYFSATDLNASFEGIAVSPTRIYLANERKEGRIIVVDSSSLTIVDSFVVRPAGVRSFDVHYSDLCWFEGALYVLLRESRVVLKVDPATHRVLAQYDFRAMETDPKVAYFSLYFFVGTMEGLAVDHETIWLVTDNNGLGRIQHPKDIRPTLFKCRRPDLH